MDEVLNVVLFVLIGLELRLDAGVLLLGATAVPIVLLARCVSVGGSVALLRRRRSFSPHTVRILTWGGVRGGSPWRSRSPRPPRAATRSWP